eukprot:TRINITY_DN7454_c0_g1_i1.p1 TRINITY_DN7454_c0_g1~~TRINITY_DN7454_c0_g1_i1.p1  ORF type:complete len:181 (+),score=16.58 TRINITY_DN7454_c0_g1_i1:28-543(+)
MYDSSSVALTVTTPQAPEYYLATSPGPPQLQNPRRRLIYLTAACVSILIAVIAALLLTTGPGVVQDTIQWMTRWTTAGEGDAKAQPERTLHPVGRRLRGLMPKHTVPTFVITTDSWDDFSAELLLLILFPVFLLLFIFFVVVTVVVVVTTADAVAESSSSSHYCAYHGTYH